MSFLALAAALGAALCWAAGSLIAHFPSQALGAFAFTRIQLITSGMLLGVLVLLTGTWGTIAWNYWKALVVSSLVSVVLGNLCMIACLRRGGPRRMQLLFSLNAPLAAILGYFFLGEILGTQDIIGCLFALTGVVLAILFGSKKAQASTEESGQNAIQGNLRFEAVKGSVYLVVLFGLMSATCQAIGLITIKPVMLAGTDPFAASFLRTGGAALVLLLFSPLVALKGSSDTSRAELSLKLFGWTVLPGFLGYVCAVSLILYALNNYNTAVVAVFGSTAPVLLLPILWWRTKQCPLAPAWVGAFLTVIGAGLIATS
ncbi:hypothetical protein WH96_13260 [Kiloniella spongiae]|uniref:EamA domain-containing protein n=1 Tax=Kiloniella spongiae TaxID=1489064 RepID=A0A0H2MD70_9PROT|nr:DMT family transporter [Kiloniella spongiae]KLN60151.1 hypothetical protein WH96_13260 [Kiloniella spongiae]